MNIDTGLGAFHLSDDGRCVLVFERRLTHPPRKVWQAITEIAHLRRWFADILDYDRATLDLSTEGAELAFVPTPDFENVGTQYGRVVRAVAPEVLEYTWGHEILTWELEPDDDGGCILTFTNTFDDRDFAPFNAVGWHTALDRLSALLADRDPSRIPLEVDERVAEELQSQYTRSIG